MDITFYITIAGKSKRMGADKSSMQLGDKTFLEWTVETVNKLGYSPIIVINNESYVQHQLICIQDYNPSIGPIGGLYQSLQHSKSDYVFYLSCDVPLLPINVIKSVLRQANQKSCALVSYESNIYPLIGIYHKSLLPLIQSMIENNNYRMMDVFNQANGFTISVDAYVSDKILLNCNTIENFEKLKCYLTNHQ